MWHVIRLGSPATVASDFARPSLPKMTSLSAAAVVRQRSAISMAPRAALPSQRRSSPSATLPRALRARLARFVGVRDSDTPEGELLVLPAEFRYCTTQVRALDGFARQGEALQVIVSISVSRSTRLRPSTKRSVARRQASAWPPGWPTSLGTRIKRFAEESGKFRKFSS